MGSFRSGELGNEMGERPVAGCACQGPNWRAGDGLLAIIVSYK